MSQLPRGWAMATIGELSDDCSQRVPDAEESFLYIDIASIDRSTKRVASPQALAGADAPSRARKEVRTGDVLVSMTRPNLNAVAMVSPELDAQIASTGFDVLRPLLIDPRWLFYLVRTKGFVESMSDLVQGALYPAVRSKDVRGFASPVAPLAEQKRIADKLDALLARVDSCRGRLDGVPVALERFRQSVLVAAVSGKLTQQWRAERGQSDATMSCPLGEASVEVPASWQLESLAKIIDPKRPLCYGVVQPGPEGERGVPLIRVQDIENGSVLVGQLRTISAEIDQEYRRSRVQEGDLLISVVGTIGRTAVVPKNVEANIARAVARVACRAGVESRWVNTWLSASPLQWWLVSNAKEVARKTLNLSDLAVAPIAVPPEDEQKEIVRRVESLLAIMGRAQSQYERGRERLDKISPALLAKAFRGELVSQDPSDEPAQELLERLRTLREEIVKPKRGRQRTFGVKPVKSTDKDKIKAAILKLKRSSFSFDELRAHVGGDYDSIKDALFELLQEPDPVVRQFFDKKAKAMQIVRVKP